MMSAIHVDTVSKSFPGVTAVDNLSFSVQSGEIFGLLGPNGAGKSTLLSMMEGLRAADNGRIHILGLDVHRQPRQVKQRIGVQLQSTSLLPDLTAQDQVMLFARLYGRAIHRHTALALLTQVGLAEKAHTLPDAMSGGQQQRLALALALVNDPEIVFLDEPTAGLDPQSRRALWEMIRGLQQNGRTIVLTTHYLEEAEALCHRVGIIDKGRLLALDTPGRLINQLAGMATLTTAAQLPLDEVAALPGVHQAQRDGRLLRIQCADVTAVNEALLALARRHAVTLSDLHIRQPGLEDVFLQLTGRALHDT